MAANAQCIFQVACIGCGLQTLKSTQAMADAMRGATKAMGAMNKQMNLPALTKIMRDFERQNEKMEMTSEMMGDAVDDAFEVWCPLHNPGIDIVKRQRICRCILVECPILSPFSEVHEGCMHEDHSVFVLC